ncbi:hypothetical protein HanIR_Chr11g0548171 [Helianthus annuus]|nr:hypothetical protein HanIR_Chr11g0548171 [Helianthus annuus]
MWTFSSRQGIWATATVTTDGDAARHRIPHMSLSKHETRERQRLPQAAMRPAPHPTHKASGTDTTEQVASLAVACQAIRKQRTDTAVGRGFNSTTDKSDTPAKGQHVVSPSLQPLLHSSAINTNPKSGLRYLSTTLSLLLLSHFASQANY